MRECQFDFSKTELSILDSVMFLIVKDKPVTVASIMFYSGVGRTKIYEFIRDYREIQ